MASLSMYILCVFSLSLDWVLSHWAHFTVHRFICIISVYFVLFSCCISVVLFWVRWVGPGGIEA